MRAVASTLLAATALAALPAAPAAAGPRVVATAGSQRINAVRLSSGGTGRALLWWTTAGPSGSRGFIAARTSSGGLGPAVELLHGERITDVPFAFAARSGDVVLAQTTAPDYSSADLLGIRREHGADAFSEPFGILHSRYYNGVSAAANARGDLAVLVKDRNRMTQLLTAGPDGRLSAPQPLGDEAPRGEPRVALDPAGRIVVVYGSHAEAVVRRGRIGGRLGAPHILEHLRTWPTFSAAIDDHGTATVAFSRFGRYHRGRRTAVSAVAARAPAGRPFGPVVELEQHTDGADPVVAAAGTATAVAWERSYPVGGLRIVLGHGASAFGRVRSVGARPLHLGSRLSSAPYAPLLAVDAAGDVLLAYAYGTLSTHATIRLAGSGRFEPPAVVSSLGHGGTPAVAFAADRTPLVAFSDRSAVYLGDPATGAPVNLRPPSVTMTPLDPFELDRDLRVTTQVECTQTCWIFARSRITTGPGPGARQVRSGGRLVGQTLRAGERLTLTFDAKPAAQAALDASGHAKAVVTVTVANASGASRTAREVVEFGCKRVTSACPPAPGG